MFVSCLLLAFECFCLWLSWIVFHCDTSVRCVPNRRCRTKKGHGRPIRNGKLICSERPATHVGWWSYSVLTATDARATSVHRVNGCNSFQKKVINSVKQIEPCDKIISYVSTHNRFLLCREYSKVTPWKMESNGSRRKHTEKGWNILRRGYCLRGQFV